MHYILKEKSTNNRIHIDMARSVLSSWHIKRRMINDIIDQLLEHNLAEIKREFIVLSDLPDFFGSKENAELKIKEARSLFQKFFMF